MRDARAQHNDSNGFILRGLRTCLDDQTKERLLRADACAAHADKRSRARLVAVSATVQFSSRSVAANSRSARWTALRGASRLISRSRASKAAASCSRLPRLMTTSTYRGLRRRVAQRHGAGRLEGRQRPQLDVHHHHMHLLVLGRALLEVSTAAAGGHADVELRSDRVPGPAEWSAWWRRTPLDHAG